MIKSLLNSLKKGDALNANDIKNVFDEMLDGKYAEHEIADFLVYLAKKGETAEEIAMAAQSLRGYADSFDTGMKLLDTCGTGGDKKSTFNISTAAAIVCSLFVPVAKHGNKAVSSKSGSADVLESLGAEINLKKQKAYEYLRENNFVFLFAPNYHPAMRFVAGVRKKLGIRTIFNLLGPLCNPFNPSYQTIGVFSKSVLETMFEASKLLSMDNVIFLASNDGLDEISISDITICYERNGSKEDKFEFDPREMGIYADISAIRGYDATTNARLMIEVFENKHEDLKNAVAINAAFALKSAGVEDNIKDAFALAYESIEQKRALEKLKSLQGGNDAS